MSKLRDFLYVIQGDTVNSNGNPTCKYAIIKYGLEDGIPHTFFSVAHVHVRLLS